MGVGDELAADGVPMTGGRTGGSRKTLERGKRVVEPSGRIEVSDLPEAVSAP